jgi:hypothetical protein
VKRYTEGDLNIDVALEDGVAVMRWRGRSSARDPGATLHPFFTAVASEASGASATIEMRLHELEYVNSSTLAAIIRALRGFRGLGIRTRITYPASGWQRRSCEPLRVLEGDGFVEIASE